MNNIKWVYLIFLFQFNFLELKAQDPFNDVNEFYQPKTQIQNGADCIVACQTFDTITINNGQYFYQAGIKIFLIRNREIYTSKIISTQYDTSLVPICFIETQSGMKLFSMVEIKNRDVLIRIDEIDEANLEILNSKYFQTGFIHGSRIDPNKRVTIISNNSNYYGVMNLDTTEYPHLLSASSPYVFRINVSDSFVQTTKISEFGYEVQDIVFEKEECKVYITGDEMRVLRLDTLLRITSGDTSNNILFFSTAPYIGKVNGIVQDSNSYSIGIVDSVFSPDLPIISESKIAVTKFNINTEESERYSFSIREVDDVSNDYDYRIGYTKSIFKEYGSAYILFDYYYRFGNLSKENAVFVKILNDSMKDIGTYRYSKSGKVLRATSATFFNNYAYILLAEYNLNVKKGVCKPSMIILSLDSLKTGILKQEQSTSEVYVFPNPTTGLVNIHSIEGINFDSIDLIDILGQSFTCEVIENKFKTGEISKGIYIGILKSGENTKKIKLVID